MDNFGVDDLVQHAARSSCVEYRFDPPLARRMLPGPFDIQVRGAGFSSGAALRFENGGGTAPRVRSLRVVDAQTLASQIDVRLKGPARTRYWDVVVTLPSGATARLVRGLRVDP